MKAIWTQEEASSHGEFVNFDRIWSWPKPIQKPHPPILLGSHGPRALQRVVRYCDGWSPNAANPKSLIPQITELRRCAEQGGRDPKSISITAFGAKPEREMIDQYQAGGVERAVFFLPPGGGGQGASCSRWLHQDNLDLSSRFGRIRPQMLLGDGGDRAREGGLVKRRKKTIAARRATLVDRDPDAARRGERGNIFDSRPLRMSYRSRLSQNQVKSESGCDPHESGLVR